MQYVVEIFKLIQVRTNILPGSLFYIVFILLIWLSLTPLCFTDPIDTLITFSCTSFLCSMVNQSICMPLTLELFSVLWSCAIVYCYYWFQRMEQPSPYGYSTIKMAEVVTGRWISLSKSRLYASRWFLSASKSIGKSSRRVSRIGLLTFSREQLD